MWRKNKQKKKKKKKKRRVTSTRKVSEMFEWDQWF